MFQNYNININVRRYVRQKYSRTDALMERFGYKVFERTLLLLLLAGTNFSEFSDDIIIAKKSTHKILIIILIMLSILH